MMCRRHHSAVVMVQGQRSKVANTDGNNEWRSEIWRARLAWRQKKRPLSQQKQKYYLVFDTHRERKTDGSKQIVCLSYVYPKQGYVLHRSYPLHDVTRREYLLPIY